MDQKTIKQKIKRIAEKYKLGTVYLFGSRARGDAGKESDFDFGVILSNRVRPTRYFDYQVKLSAELSRLFGARADVVIMNDEKVPLLLKFNIIKEAKTMWRGNERQRVDLEVSVMNRWCDWQYYENIWSEIYLIKMAKKKI